MEGFSSPESVYLPFSNFFFSFFTIPLFYTFTCLHILLCSYDKTYHYWKLVVKLYSEPRLCLLAYLLAWLHRIAWQGIAWHICPAPKGIARGEAWWGEVKLDLVDDERLPGWSQTKSKVSGHGVVSCAFGSRNCFPPFRFNLFFFFISLLLWLFCCGYSCLIRLSVYWLFFLFYILSVYLSRTVFSTSVSQFANLNLSIYVFIYLYVISLYTVHIFYMYTHIHISIKTL